MIYFLCIIVHLIALSTIVYTWKWKALAHPGTYFIFIWIVSSISEWFLLSIGRAVLIEQSLINELNIYAAFTSCIFMIFSIISSKQAKQKIKVNIVKKPKALLIYIYICLILTCILFLLNGASLSFAQNRLSNTGDLAHIGRNRSFFESIIYIIIAPSRFFNIVMGIGFIYYLNNFKFKFKKYELVLPFLITFINALIIGGRNPIAVGIKDYLLGVGLGISTLPFALPKDSKRKILKFLSYTFICFTLFSTIVAKNRNEAFGISSNETIYDNNVIKLFSGVMEYMSAHYWGYQLRRNDFSSGDELTYGICTFYGVGAIRIPFSSILGIEGDLWSILGVEYDPNDIYISQVDGYYTTSSIFALLVRDFGVRGTYIAIILLVAITQFVFNNLFKRQHNTALSLIPHLMFFIYWSSSNFNRGLPDLYLLLISALLFDISQNNYKNKKNTNRYQIPKYEKN